MRQFEGQRRKDLPVMSDFAKETAQRAAIYEVEKLLQRSEDLKRLPALLQSYSTKRQVSFVILDYIFTLEEDRLPVHK